MFKIITECLDVLPIDTSAGVGADLSGLSAAPPPPRHPHFIIWCDHRNCDQAVGGDADIRTQNGATASQGAFIEGVRKLGWVVGLDAQLCPHHGKMLVEDAKRRMEEQRLVKPVGSMDGLRVLGQGPRKTN